MNKCFLQVVFVLFAGLDSVDLYAQQFDRAYDLDDFYSQENGVGILPLADGGYMVFGSRSLNAASIRTVIALKLSPEGDTAFSHESQDTPGVAYPSEWGSAVPFGSTRFCIPGYVKPAAFRLPALFLTDLDGEFISELIVDVPFNSLPLIEAEEGSDEELVVVGISGTDVVLAKVDAQGTLTWNRSYPQWSISEPNASLALGPENDFVLGLLGNVEGASAVVVRMDQEGDVLWTTEIGSGNLDQVCPRIHLTSDDHILAAGSWGGPLMNNTATPRLTKLNLDGDIVWAKSYGPITSFPPGNPVGFHSVREAIGSGDLIAAGEMIASSQPYQRGLLLRTSTTGDSLWMRQYAHHYVGCPDAYGYFVDAVPTSDGGAVAVGTTGACEDGSADDDVWVMKVDSLGCIEPGCGLVTGIDVQIANLQSALQLSPNPTEHGGFVQAKIKLPDGFAERGMLRLTLVSSDGRLISEESFAPSVSSISIPTGDLRQGLYHLHLSDASRWISGAKLLVQ